MTRSYRSVESSIQQWIWQQTQALLPQHDSQENQPLHETDSQNPAIVWYNLAILGLASPLI